jgi:fermentation-respiration switch protein FrsA (DUF1100 family)
MRSSLFHRITVAAMMALLVAGSIAARAQSNDPPVLARQFVERMAADDFPGAFALFSPRLKKAFPQTELWKSWDEIHEQIGGFKRWLKVDPRDDAVVVTCQFARGKRELKVAFNSKGEIKSFSWAELDLTAISLGVPAYANTNSFQESEFTVTCGKWSLPGTLTVPRGVGPWPAVVLVHGSGPNDRDERVEANRPFRDLAWGLATRGVAVLRYDKRTHVYGANAFTNVQRFTVQEETIDDAVAAAAELRRVWGIDPGRVFVAGHSLGGTLGPRIAQADPGLAGLIILAGSTRPYEDLILEQNAYNFALDGPLSARDEAQLETVRAVVRRIKSFTTNDLDLPVAPLGSPPGYWLDLNAYDSAATARTLRLPILILQGARDYQVTTVDFDGWKRGLAAQTNVSFKLYPNLNHLFMTGTGKSTPMEYEEPGHVDEPVINDIAAWVQTAGSAKGKDFGNQSTNFVIGPEQQRDDVRFLMKTLEEVHPNLYFQVSREEIRRRLDELDRRLTNSLTRLEFYHTLAPFVYGFEDDHTELFTPVGATRAKRDNDVDISIPAYRWKFDVLDGNIGYLDFVRMAEPGLFNDFLAQTFAAIKDKHVAGLIIDLRKNGGGNSDLGDALLDYVNDRPYRGDSRKEWRISRQFIATIPRVFKEFWTNEPGDEVKQFCSSNPPPMLQRLLAQNPGVELKTFLNQRAPAWVKDYLRKQAPHWLDPAYSPETGSETLVFDFTELRQPAKDFPLRFNGPVCFLIGPYTFSSAVILGNSVEDFHLATLIGAETHRCNQFGEPCYFTLPHSHLYGGVSTAQFVRANGDAKNPHGVLPNLKVEQTKADQEKGVDTVLEAAKQWVREHPGVRF